MRPWFCISRCTCGSVVQPQLRSSTPPALTVAMEAGAGERVGVWELFTRPAVARHTFLPTSATGLWSSLKTNGFLWSAWSGPGRIQGPLCAHGGGRVSASSRVGGAYGGSAAPFPIDRQHFTCRDWLLQARAPQGSFHCIFMETVG